MCLLRPDALTPTLSHGEREHTLKAVCEDGLAVYLGKYRHQISHEKRQVCRTVQHISTPGGERNVTQHQ